VRRVSATSLVGVGSGAITLVAVIALLTPPADGYEMSIYAAFPWYFWVLLIASLLIGHLIVLREGLSPDEARPDWWLGLLLVLLGNVVLVFLPYVRGYPYFERADVLTHLGHIRTVQTTGAIGPENIYPNIHQLVLALAYATGLEPMRVINAVSGVISLFSILASVALVAAVYDRRRALFSVPFVSVLLGGTAHMNPSPFAQSMLILPFVLYLFVREQQTHALTVRVALVVSLVALVFYHPLTTLFALVFFVVYGVLQRPRVKRSLLGPDRDGDGGVAGGLTGPGTARRLVLGTFVAWYYNFAGMLIRAESVLNTLFGTGGGESTLDSYSSTVSRTSPALVDLLRILLLEYGTAIVVLGVSGLHLANAVVERTRNRLSMTVFELSFSVTAMAFSGLAVVFLVFDLIVGFGRPLMAARYFGVLVVGSLFFDLYRRTGENPNVPRAIGIVLTVLIVFSAFGLYHSPLTIGINQQVTEAELDGSEWYLSQADGDVPHTELGIDLYRFEDAMVGFQADDVTKDPEPPPDHFGYATGETLGEVYNESHYLVITPAGRQFYPKIWSDYEQYWRYTPADFERLETDPTVSRVYANGGFETYHVTGTNATA
jgi:hypothetical protein